MFTCMLGRYTASTVSLVPKPFREGADRVGGQLRRDEECPFNGVTNSGRVWRNTRCRKAMRGLSAGLA